MLPFSLTGGPPEAFMQAFEQSLDRSRPVIGYRLQRIGEEWEFFMLGADAPLAARLLAGGEIFNELALVGDDGARFGRLGGRSAQASCSILPRASI